MNMIKNESQNRSPDRQTGHVTCECGQVLLLLSECVAPFFALGLRPNASASKLPTLLRNRVKRVRFALRVTGLRWFGWGFRVTAESHDSSDVCPFTIQMVARMASVASLVLPGLNILCNRFVRAKGWNGTSEDCFCDSFHTRLLSF